MANMEAVKARIQEIHQCTDWSQPSPDGFATLKEEYDYLQALLAEAEATHPVAEPEPEAEPEAEPEVEPEPEAVEPDGQEVDPTDED